jgi:disulfide bond formation protein DsbB
MSRFSEWVDHNSLYIGLLAAWIAMFGSLYFSEVAGYVPCTLCWYQRILMYPLTLVLAIGLLRRDPHLPWLVLPLSILGLAIAIYHYLLEKTDLFAHSNVCGTGVSCTTVWINWFGFVTIPFLSLAGFLIITVMTLIALNAGEPDGDPEQPTPWLSVLGLIGVVILAFGILFQSGQNESASAIFPVADASAAGAQSRAPRAGEEPLALGQRLYQEACAGCHGFQREGVPDLGNALMDSAFIHEQSDEALLAFIRAGRANNDPANQSGLVMPASGGRPDLTDSQLSAIIRYLRTESE